MFPVSTEAVAELVAEHGNTRHTRYIGLHRQLFFRQLRFLRRPTFAINEDGRVYLAQGGPYLVHGLDVMQPHQVETETIDVIFLGPITDRLHHVTPHHRTFAGGLVSATGTVREIPVRIVAVKIPRHRTFEIASMCLGRMVKHHVHNHPDAGFVQSHDHLLEFPDTDFGSKRVCRIRALGYLIVLRVIPPVILRLVRFRFIHRRKIERREQMYMGDAQLLQMADTGLVPPIGMGTVFCQCQILSPVPDTRNRIDGEIAVVQLINHDVGEMIQYRTPVVCPPFGIGCPQIQNGCPVTVHSYRPCHQSRCISLPYLINLGIESIEFSFQVFSYPGIPHPVFSRLHRYHAVHGTLAAMLIQHDPHFAGSRCPQREPCLCRRIDHFFPRSVINRILVKTAVSALVTGGTAQQGYDRHKQEYFETHNFYLFDNFIRILRNEILPARISLRE